MADQLDLERFRVSGWSIGGSHALATAYALAERVVATTVAAPMPPPGLANALNDMSGADKAALTAARKLPGLVRLGTRLSASSLQRNPVRALGRLRKAAPEADRQLIDDPAFEQMFLPAISEAYRQGTGPGWESTMIVQPWGFDVSAITGRVDVWQGSADPVIPIAAGRSISDGIPAANLHEVEGGGHMMFFQRWSEILARLLN